MEEARAVCLRLRQQRDALAEEATTSGADVVAQRAELAQLRRDLEQVRQSEQALLEGKAQLEVETKRAQRDLQTSEIMCVSVKEQLQARSAEVAQLAAEARQAQARQAALAAELAAATAALHKLESDHGSLAQHSAEEQERLEQQVAGLQTALKDWQLQVAAGQEERQALEGRLKESAAKESVTLGELRQLSAAHEQQAGRLRQEVDQRRTLEDEVQALRAGLQVTQQRLEGLGLVFASSAVHKTSAEVWRVVGPLSMGRQVVAAMNKQMGELVARQQELQHGLGVAKERWQTEEGVRVK